MQFLFDLEQISFKSFVICIATDSIMLGLVNRNPNRIFEIRWKQIILGKIERKYL